MIVESLLREALGRYGIKLRIVLETALEIAKKNRLMGSTSLGDFDYKSLVLELEKRGFKYNPSQLLRILEREYGILETTYHSSGQRWYRFKNLDIIERVLLGDNFVDEEPEVKVLKVQIKSLQLNKVINYLKRLELKSRLSSSDLKKFRQIAFEYLPRVVKLLRKAEEYEEYLYAEIELLRSVINLAYRVAEKLDYSSVSENQKLELMSSDQVIDLTNLQ